MSVDPDYTQWSRAIQHSRAARDLGFEALGFARGYCDARCVGSGEAIAFAIAFAVLVATGGSRPSIHRGWANWRAGRDLNAW
ncbi:hypothetical protein [Nocardia alni]|uniref:hypothetical protein n=1 Tax=Nocardia alni TaxID=2815723 RepID=UPI001C23A586|nr:hypothetical protein [Nocardia alni]